MNGSFIAALKGTFMLFLFIVSGYVLRKKNIAGESAGGVISSLLMNYFMPMMMIHIITQNITIEEIKTSYPVMLTACAVITVSYIAALPIARLLAKERKLRNVAVFALVFSNFGFMGIPIIEAVYGKQEFAFLAMYTIPYYLTVNVLGDYILRSDKKLNFKVIFQPVTYGIIIGFVLVLLNIRLPETAAKWVEYSYNCVIPLSMLLAGLVLGARPFSAMFRRPVIYVISLLRTVALPIVFMVILVLCGVRGTVMGIPVLIMGMPVAVNGVMLAENLGGDAFAAAQCAFISTILSLITIPALTYLVNMV